MSGITYRERGGNRRGNKKNLPLVGKFYLVLNKVFTIIL